MVAGIFSLLNDYRLSKGQASLGFINPLIYKSGYAFNDITSGYNPACGTIGKYFYLIDHIPFTFHRDTIVLVSDNVSHNLTTGFTARVGWDPVSSSALAICIPIVLIVFFAGDWARYPQLCRSQESCLRIMCSQVLEHVTMRFGRNKGSHDFKKL